jgi:hypothetical protein
MKIRYKGFDIKPEPSFLANGLYSLCVILIEHRGEESRVVEFLANNEFQTFEKAVSHSLLFGKIIIDGQVPNCYVR